MVIVAKLGTFLQNVHLIPPFSRLCMKIDF